MDPSGLIKPQSRRTYSGDGGQEPPRPARVSKNSIPRPHMSRSSEQHFRKAFIARAHCAWQKRRTMAVPARRQGRRGKGPFFAGCVRRHKSNGSRQCQPVARRGGHPRLLSSALPAPTSPAAQDSSDIANGTDPRRGAASFLRQRQKRLRNQGQTMRPIRNTAKTNSSQATGLTNRVHSDPKRISRAMSRSRSPFQISPTPEHRPRICGQKHRYYGNSNTHDSPQVCAQCLKAPDRTDCDRAIGGAGAARPCSFPPQRQKRRNYDASPRCSKADDLAIRQARACRAQTSTATKPMRHHDPENRKKEAGPKGKG